MKFSTIASLAKKSQLNTERLTLRKMNFDDFNVALSHELNPQMMHYIRDIDTMENTLKKVMNFLGDWNAYEGEWLAFSVLENSSNEVIGMVCMNVESIQYKRVEIGYRFHPDFQGKGYGIEAVQRFVAFIFDELKARKIVAYCVSEHQGSYHLMEKLGMQREACLRQHTTMGGIWYDEYVYGLFKKEFIR